MKGDWVQAKYYINSTQWTTQAQSVAPLRYCRLDQVKIYLYIYININTHTPRPQKISDYSNVLCF